MCATSLEETYEALRTFEVLGIDKKSDIDTAACQSVLEILGSPSSALKDLFYALKVNGILKCDIEKDVFEVLFCSMLFLVGRVYTLCYKKLQTMCDNGSLS